MSDTPCFMTHTIYSFEEYKRYCRTIQNKMIHRPVVIAVMMVAFALLALLADDLSMRIGFLIGALLCPLIFHIISAVMEKKAYYANRAFQDADLTYSFYPDRIETRNVLGFTTISYDQLYRVIETKQNFYLMISQNQGMIIVKQNCSPELLSFLQQLHTKAS